MDYSRAPCLGTDQKTRGLWERDYTSPFGGDLSRDMIKSLPVLFSFLMRNVGLGRPLYNNLLNP